MNRINIYERDLTTAVVEREGVDVAFVPGFAIGGDAETFKPYLCKTVDEFKQHFGSYPAKFLNDQYFADLTVSTSGIASIPSYAIPNYMFAEHTTGTTGVAGKYVVITSNWPTSNVVVGAYYAKAKESTSQYEIRVGISATETRYMNTQVIDTSRYAPIDVSPAWFNTGDYDPSYIYAMELLYQGLPVVYTKVNAYNTQEEIDSAISLGKAPQGATLADYINVVKMYEALINEVFNDDEPAAYDSTRTYVIGDKVMYQQQVYRCIVNETTGVWDETKWLLVTVNETPILDKGEYSIKYITSGGYPSFELGTLAKQMTNIAYKRGDAVAFIDHIDNPQRPISTVNTNSVYYQATKNPATAISSTYDSYATMITPWGQFRLAGAYRDLGQTIYNAKTESILPGSFAYLLSLAKSIKTYSNFLAVSGVARGLVPNLMSIHTNFVMSNAIAEAYQNETGISINPITNIRPYGYCIWGNRTLKDNTESGGTIATSFLNIRNMLSDIKKQAYMSAKSLMFEQNTDILWVKFKSMMLPTLDDMKHGQGIESYRLIKNSVNPLTGGKLPRTKLSCTIRIVPIYAVESFDIFVELTDTDIVVE